MKKKIAAAAAAVLTLCFVVGCGEKGIDGKWVKTRVEYSDGTVDKGKDIGAEEVYEISGDTGTYTCGEKSWDVTVEKDDDGYYHIKLNGKLELADHAELDGDKLSYSVTVGDETTTFIFERK